jgi:hypothetical protein
MSPHPKKDKRFWIPRREIHGPAPDRHRTPGPGLLGGEVGGGGGRSPGPGSGPSPVPAWVHIRNMYVHVYVYVYVYVLYMDLYMSSKAS